MQLLPHSLTAVRAFDAVARNMSCKRAAEELFLTQSAVSKQLQALEDSLGVRLFARVHQGLMLTDAGAAYWDGVRRALLILAEAAGRAREMESGNQLVQLVAPPTLCQKWLIPRLPDFFHRHAGIKVQFMPNSVPDLRNSSLTVEIRGGRMNASSEQAQYLFGRELYVVGSPILFRDRTSIRPEDLVSQQLFEIGRMPLVWERWFAMNKVTGHGTRNLQRFEYFSVMIEALVAGMGVALVPRCLIEDELRQQSLVLLFEESFSTEYGYYLSGHKECKRSEASDRFIEWLLAASAGQQ